MMKNPLSLAFLAACAAFLAACNPAGTPPPADAEKSVPAVAEITVGEENVPAEENLPEITVEADEFTVSADGELTLGAESVPAEAAESVPAADESVSFENVPPPAGTAESAESSAPAEAPAESVPAEASAENAGNAENAGTPAAVPADPATFAVQKVVPEDYRPAAFDIFTAGTMRWRVEFYGSDVFRIQAAPNGNFDDPLNDPTAAQILVSDLPVCRERVSCEVLPEKVVWTTAALTLVMNRADATFSLFKADGTPVFSEKKPLEFDGENVTQTLSTDADEFYYGGGQQNGHFSHKGTRIEISANGWNENDRPNPVPFYMSNRGYGVLRHTFATGHYDFTGTESIALTHYENRFDAFYFVGDGFPRVLDLYTQFTGRPNFLPIWGFELGDADAYMTRDKETKEPALTDAGTFAELTPDALEAVAQKYRENDMPAGWLLVNDGYGCNYVQLPYVVKSLAALGFKTGLWTEGALTRMKWEVGTAGTRVQKLDVAWTSDTTKTTRERPLSGIQHALECNKIAWDGIAQNSDSRPFTWTVLGWAGTQRYAVCWTGDQYGNWDLIRYHIPTLITAGLSGQAYATTDVDGIFGGSPETYTRDLQWKCFTPAIYAMNGWSGVSKSPWNYDEPYRSINRRYLKLKLRLTPYMYKFAHDAAMTGAPIVRGMLWNYPNDRKTWDKSTQYQFMLGDALLVAPVYTSMNLNKGWRKEDIYLPEGLWFDYWDGRAVPGPYTIDNYPITLEKLPIFVRAGAIIPMYPEMLYGTQKPKDTLTFDIYPYGKSSFELYEDDGNTRAYLDGKFSTQLVSCDAPAGTAGDIHVTVAPALGDFDGKYAKRIYAFEIHSPFRPLRVLANGTELREIADVRAYENSLEGWRYDASDRRGIVYVKLAEQSTAVPATVTVNISKYNAMPAFEPYPVPVVTPELDKSEFVVKASSAEGVYYPISAAFDGSAETMWHTNWTGEPESTFPHTVDIDLGKLVPVNGVAYLPRADLGLGMIKDYEIYVSRSPEEFGVPVAQGALDCGADAENPSKPRTEKIAFPTTWGRYVRFVALSAKDGGRYASAAEFDILKDLDAAPLAEETLALGDRAGVVPAEIKGEAAFNSGIADAQIVVDGEKYASGITVRAGTEIAYELDGSWDRILGFVGREIGGKGTVTFRIFADGKQIFERAGMSPNSLKQLIAVDIAGAKKIVFAFTADTGGDAADTGVWTDVRLVRNGSEE